MVDIIGWIGSILLAGCALPLSWCAIRDKSISINFPFLLIWTLGELFCFIYVVLHQDLPLVLNYSINLIFLVPVWRYRL